MIRPVLAAALAAVFLLLAQPAVSHPLDESRSEISVEGDTVRWRISVHPSFISSLDQDRDGLLAPSEIDANLPALTKFFANRLFVNVDGRLCAPRVEGVSPTLAGERVTLFVVYRCPVQIETLRIEMHLFDGVSRNWVSLARLAWGGEEREFAFRDGNRAWEIEGLPTGRSGLAAQAGSFIALGVEHIFTGYDHLMFLIGLLLLGGRFWSLFKIVTAFTIAHSVTLVLAALGIVEVSPRMIEPAIALSIAYVGAENFILKSTDRRWIIAFVFGLVHGFGFAGILQEMGLPERGLVLSLLSFNVGVEIGQITIVALVLPLILTLQRWPLHRRVVYLLSSIIIGFGLYWFVERI